MLAAELKRARLKAGASASGGSPADASVGPTSSQPLTFETLSNFSGGHHGGELRAMSLPADTHMIPLSAIPPKPRVRPSPAPSLNLADFPILELPEPSLGESASFSASPPGTVVADDDTVDAVHVEESGGTCARAPPPPPCRPSPPFARHRVRRAPAAAHARSLFVPPPRAENVFVAAASAPASMLWGPHAHKHARRAPLSPS